MGTSLTGTKPKDTYDSLIKVTDNGPLSGTAKYLSDGLGNDSALAVSTSAVGVGTASPNAPLEVQADSGGTSIRVKARAAANSGTIRFFDNASSTQLAKIESSDNGFEIGSVNNVYAAFLTNGTERMRIASAGNVGIGTSNPTTKLMVEGTGSFGTVSNEVRLQNGGTFVSSTLNAHIINSDGTGAYTSGNLLIQPRCSSGAGVTNIVFATSNNTNTPAERFRITADGVTFNGDTAAANALDDYEEGTFTSTLLGSVTDPTTPVTTTGNYTKIGRQVTISVIFANVNTTGASGAVYFTGAPFACATAGLGAVVTENFTFGATRTSVSSLIDSSAATTIRLIVSGNDTSFENLSHNAGTGRYLYTSLTYFV